MKKILAILFTLTLSVSLLAACGGNSAPAGTPSAPSSSVTDSGASAGGEVSAEQIAMIDDYNLMVDEYNAVLDEMEQYEELVAMDEVTTMVNDVTAAINSVTGVLDESGQLSDEKLTQLQQVIDDNRNFTANLQAMIDNYAGQTVVTISMQLGNDTGVDLHGVAMSPSGDESWGGNLLEAPLANGEIGTATMNITAETLVWDLLAVDANGGSIAFTGIDFSEVDTTTGAELLLTTNESGEYVVIIA